MKDKIRVWQVTLLYVVGNILPVISIILMHLVSVWFAIPYIFGFVLIFIGGYFQKYARINEERIRIKKMGR